MKNIFKIRHFFWLLIPLLLWWVLRSVSTYDLWQVISRLTVWRIIILLAVNGLIVGIFSLRWWLLLKSISTGVTYLNVLLYRLAGFGFSYFTPGPQIGGEPLQIYLLKSLNKVSLSSSVSSVAFDKLIEWFAKFLFIGVGILAIINLGLFIRSLEIDALVYTSLLIILLCLFFAALYFQKQPISRILSLLPEKWRQVKFVSGISAIVNGSESQMGELLRKNPAVVFYSLILSLLGWVIIVFEFWLVLYMLGYHFNLIQVFAALTFARVSFLVPVPAGLGTLEAGQVIIMNALQADPALGLAVSLVIRGRDIFFGIAGLITGYILLGNFKWFKFDKIKPVIQEQNREE